MSADDQHTGAPGAAVDPRIWLHDRLDREPPAPEPARAAAVALLEAEQREADLDGLEALSDFERELVERAYRQGGRDAIAHVGKMIGPAAATLDAQSVRSALAAGGGFDLETRFRPPFLEGQRWVTPGHLRAAELVAGARKGAGATLALRAGFVLRIRELDDVEHDAQGGGGWSLTLTSPGGDVILADQARNDDGAVALREVLDRATEEIAGYLGEPAA